MPPNVVRAALVGAYGLLLGACAASSLHHAPQTAHAPTTENRPSHDASAIAHSPHVRFGIPRDADPSDDQLLDRGAFVASYNPTRKLANWVAWRLTAADLGSAGRSRHFSADSLLPTAERVFPDAYTRSGYDRGHLCPSSHRTRDADTNATTFLMSNMHPQVHALNAGPWKSAEMYEQKLAATGKDVYVVAGGVFAKQPQTIGDGIPVPNASFRIALVVDHAAPNSDVTPATPLYAEEMPNNDSARGKPWSSFATRVDDVERDTGYDFLANLPDEVEAPLEASARP
jgi:endonuclease G